MPVLLTLSSAVRVRVWISLFFTNLPNICLSHIKCLVFHSLHISPLIFLHAPMPKLFVCQTNACASVSLSMGGVTGFLFVFQTPWGQTGSTELTMHLLVCNQPEISSKQTQSYRTETRNIHIFHLAANLLAEKQVSRCLWNFLKQHVGLEGEVQREKCRDVRWLF